MDNEHDTVEVPSVSDNTDHENMVSPEPAPTPDVVGWLLERVDSLEKHVELLENRLSQDEMKNRF